MLLPIWCICEWTVYLWQIPNLSPICESIILYCKHYVYYQYLKRRNQYFYQLNYFTCKAKHYHLFSQNSRSSLNLWLLHFAALIFELYNTCLLEWSGYIEWLNSILNIKNIQIFRQIKIRYTFIFLINVLWTELRWMMMVFHVLAFFYLQFLNLKISLIKLIKLVTKLLSGLWIKIKMLKLWFYITYYIFLW